jgi:hypothetical protein
MRFNSQELGVKLGESECEGQSDCGDITDNPICGCTYPSVEQQPCEKSHGDSDSKEGMRGPGKGEEGKGSHLAGLELLRAQLRESIDGAAP